MPRDKIILACTVCQERNYFTTKNRLWNEIVANGYHVTNEGGVLPYEDAILDFSNPEVIEQHINSNTKLIWLETPTNPLLGLADMAALAKAAPQDVIVAVDNTFASPYLQSPLQLGVDIVLQSTTKSIGGHSDVVGGALMAYPLAAWVAG